MAHQFTSGNGRIYLRAADNKHQAGSVAAAALAGPARPTRVNQLPTVAQVRGIVGLTHPIAAAALDCKVTEPGVIHVPARVVRNIAVWAKEQLDSGQFGEGDFGTTQPLPRDVHGRLGEVAVTAAYLDNGQPLSYPRADKPACWDLKVGSGRGLRIDVKTWGQSSVDDDLSMCLSHRKHRNELLRPVSDQSEVLVFTHATSPLPSRWWVGQGRNQGISESAEFHAITIQVDGWAPICEMEQLPLLRTGKGMRARVATDADVRAGNGLNYSANPNVAAQLGYVSPLRTGLPAALVAA